MPHKHWLAEFLRRLFLQWGMLPGIAAITLFALVLAWSSSFLLARVTNFPSEHFYLLLIIATVVPLIVAPVASFVILQLLYELQAANEVSQRLTTIDELTDTHNRRYFIEAAERALAVALRYDRSLALAMLDIDFFKAINDSRGHAGGDEILRRITKICQAQLRQSDIFARLGGDEFAILMPGTDHAAAMIVADRLRQAISDAKLPAAAGKEVTVSLGVAARTANVATVQHLLAVADAALYTAKHAGRDCVRG